MRRLTKSFQNWIDDERGGIAIFGLYMFMSVLIMAGLAIDMSHLINNKTRLQIAADTAAHAALYNRDTKSADDSKVAALAGLRSRSLVSCGMAPRSGGQGRTPAPRFVAPLRVSRVGSRCPCE